MTAAGSLQRWQRRPPGKRRVENLQEIGDTHIFQHVTGNLAWFSLETNDELEYRQRFDIEA